MKVNIWVILLLGIGTGLLGQESIRKVEQSVEIGITKAFFDNLELENQSALIQPNPIKFPIGGGDTLLIQCKGVHTFATGGVVAEYDVLEGDAIHFLISKFGDNYYGSFIYHSWQYNIKEALSGNYEIFREIWKNETCGLDGSSEGLTYRNTNAEKHSVSSGDPIRLLVAYNDEAIQRASQQTSVESDTAVYLWTHAAVTMMNITLRESGSMHSIDLIDLEYVDYNNQTVNGALGPFSSLSGPFSELVPVIKNSCIEIRSFLMDYSGSGPLGIATSLNRNSSSLSSVSVISMATFCHELGHLLGFGHGPQGPDDTGYFYHSRAFSTQHHGIPGENLSTLMDYGRRTFIFSNLLKPYQGDYTEFHGQIFGTENRNHIRTLDQTYPIVKDISSPVESVSKSICAGDSLFGYTEAGFYRDTLEDPLSCTGHRYRRLNLSVEPPLETDFEHSSVEQIYDRNEEFDSTALKFGQEINGEVYLCSDYHIYRAEQQNFEKIASFPDPENGKPADPDDYEIILDFDYVLGELYVHSNFGVYFYDKTNRQWIEISDLDKIPQMIRNRQFRNTTKKVFYRDPGMDWIECDIPFPDPEEVNIFSVNVVSDVIFVMQLNKKVLYLSSDRGENWIEAETTQAIDTRRMYYYKGRYYAKTFSSQKIFQSENGEDWEPAEFGGVNTNALYHDKKKDKLYLSRGNKQLYGLNDDTNTDFYYGSLKYYPDFISDDYIYCIEGSAFSEDNLLVYGISEVSQYHEQVTLCPGEDYRGIDSAGFYKVPFQSAGCDSLVTVEIMEDSVLITMEEATICYGAEYKGHNTEGIKSDTFSSSRSCDSIHIIDLKILDSISIEAEIKHVQGGSPGRIALNIAGGQIPYTYQWSNGDTTAVIDMLEPGNYSVTVSDALGCSRVEEFAISMISSTSNPGSINPPVISPNPVKAGQEIRLDMQTTYLATINMYSLSGKLVRTSSTRRMTLKAPEQPGVYFIKINTKSKQFQEKIIVW